MRSSINYKSIPPLLICDFVWPNLIIRVCHKTHHSKNIHPESSALFTEFFLKSYVSSFHFQDISFRQKASTNSGTSFMSHLSLTLKVFQWLRLCAGIIQKARESSVRLKQGLPATQFTPCPRSWVVIYFHDCYRIILLWLCLLRSKAALHKLRLIMYEGLYF